MGRSVVHRSRPLPSDSTFRQKAAERAQNGTVLLLQLSDASVFEFDAASASLPIAGLKLK